ncbi:hypothetical protein CEXT_154511 [Caerostris extrusa]|uniref:Secreted protein n=1 Tax=Caerostris extrusa TaxID=172846 RepID=A0AAV4QFE8_CAEEX|nr:hypothetical protein CEXT_154511 [Caerostris extrusa]
MSHVFFCLAIYRLYSQLRLLAESQVSLFKRREGGTSSFCSNSITGSSPCPGLSPWREARERDGDTTARTGKKGKKKTTNFVPG